MTQPDLGHLPVVAVRLLDGFGLVIDNRMTPIIPSSQRILAYLALHERPVDRGVLAEALWPDIPIRRAAARLRSALWRLVRPTCPIVETDRSTLGLADSVTVDVTTVRRFAAALATPGPLERTPPVSLSAELLPGWTEQWVAVERDWFQQMCLRTLEALSERFRAHGDHFHAHEAAEAAVRLDPLRESAYRKLIELHLSDNNPAAAVRQYTNYRRRLHAELGLQPSPEIHRLLEPVLARRNLR